MLNTIHCMSHTFRIAYGGSNTTYGGYTIPGELWHFMMGLSQGNGCATQIWSIISYIVFSAIRSQGFGIHIINSFTTEIEKLVGFSYIDDFDTIQSDDDIYSTHLQMQLTISE